ncbi:hypothetical protein ACOSP7_009216 [Xanthoceras sorbifolium]
MGQLKKLELCGTAIQELSPSIKYLYGLWELSLKGCKNLVTFRNSICNLEYLTHLNLSDCSKLGKLPGSLISFMDGILRRADIPQTLPPLSGLRSLRELSLNNCSLTGISEVGCLSSLKALDLSRNSFLSLPKSIIELSTLTKLKLNDCNMLQSLTELPAHIEYLEAMNCKKLWI